MRQEHISGYYSGAVESRILQAMEKLGSCTLDELIQTLPAYIRRHVFIAIDRLHQDGALILRHPTRFTCVVEVGRGHLSASRPVSRV
jgi:hypothetical protein